LPEPGANWPKSLLELDWTREGTDEFLGHGAATPLRSRSPIGVWCRLSRAWNPQMETKVGDEGEGDALATNAAK
jgi:hypothetical protein